MDHQPPIPIADNLLNSNGSILDGLVRDSDGGLEDGRPAGAGVADVEADCPVVILNVLAIIWTPTITGASTPELSKVPTVPLSDWSCVEGTLGFGRIHLHHYILVIAILYCGMPNGFGGLSIAIRGVNDNPAWSIANDIIHHHGIAEPMVDLKL